MAIAKVVHVNKRRGMFVAKLDSGTHSVIEIFDTYEVERGAALKGDIDDGGSCVIYDLDADMSFDGIVQFTGCTLEYAMQKVK